MFNPDQAEQQLRGLTTELRSAISQAMAEGADWVDIDVQVRGNRRVAEAVVPDAFVRAFKEKTHD
jgi:hypothetical protein